MTRQLWLKALLVWVIFIPIAIINGLVRNMVFAPIIGELGGHQLSTLIGILLYGSLVYLLFRQEIPHLKKSSLIKLGLVWVGLTILFEFGFGHYVMGHSWARLWHDYDLSEGRVWSLMLVSIGIWPLLIQTLIKRTSV